MMTRAAAQICGLLVLLAGAGLPLPVSAQTAEVPASTPILTLDQDALYLRSLYGQALRARIAEEVAKVEEQTRRIDAELEAEERELTQKRSEMTLEEFAPLARAFDDKVQRLRAENLAATETVRKKEQEGRAEFIAVASEVVGDYMVERGAVAIIDKGAVIVSLLGLDVTDAVVARIDQVLGNGDTP
jgi:Skp family chaperone for outer membrane proteins